MHTLNLILDLKRPASKCCSWIFVSVKMICHSLLKSAMKYSLLKGDLSTHIIHNPDYCSHMFWGFHHLDISLYLQVLDISEADMVLAERGLLPQSARILALVERKEPRALVGFLGSLHQSNHHHIADILEMPNDAEHLGEVLNKLRLVQFN